MALINLIAKSNKEINWECFLEDYSNLQLFDIEIFPIPKNLGFDFDCVGINVHKGYSNRKAVISNLERAITFFYLEPYGLKFVELYEGVEVYPDNALVLFDKLLPY